jgi:hypothetical protein
LGLVLWECVRLGARASGGERVMGVGTRWDGMSDED